MPRLVATLFLPSWGRIAAALGGLASTMVLGARQRGADDGGAPR